jgi:sterol desaturase/sphingolipid hydroxylase (fatty acid hydroxylase superfamily)
VHLDDLILLAAIPAFGLSMALEAWKLRGGDHGHKGYTPADSFGSLSLGIGYLGIAAVYKVVFVGAMLWLYQFRLFDIEVGLLSWLALVVLDDLCMYASHRAGHEVRILWCAHHQHHSSDHYNLSTALRQSWTEHLTAPLFWAILPLIGFPVEMILVQMALNLLYQYWLHTELIGDMGRFGWVFNTPAFHRVHHGRNPQYLDRNYGGIFIVWDRLFGTFEPEGEPVDYGVTNPVGSDNPFRIAAHEYLHLWEDLRQVRSLRGALGVVFGPPGWSESGRHQTAADARRSWEAQLGG